MPSVIASAVSSGNNWRDEREKEKEKARAERASVYELINGGMFTFPLVPCRLSQCSSPFATYIQNAGEKRPRALPFYRGKLPLILIEHTGMNGCAGADLFIT